MALRFMDSFDHYVTADILSKWTAQPSAPGNQSIESGGRSGAQRLHMQGTNTPILDKTLDSQPTWIIGLAMLFPVSVPSDICVSLLDAGTYQMELRINSSQSFYVSRGGTTIATGTKVLSQNVWYYIEFKVTIANAGGIAIVKINGVEDINFSGDTQFTANATANTIRLGNTVRFYCDDLYVCDGTGSAPTNDFLGDCRVETLAPSGNGNSSQMVGSDADSTDNYLLVDETAQDGDTTYVESSTVGNKDTYVYGNLTPTTGTVYGVQVLPYAKKTDAGTRSIVSVARLSATEVDSAVQTLSSTYTYLPDIREAKPGGGTWSITNVNDAEFGVKVNA